MALLFCDSFDAYAGASDAVAYGKWTTYSSGGWSNTVGKFGGGGFTTGSPNGARATKNIATASGNTLYVGWYVASAPASSIGNDLLRINGLSILNIDTNGSVILVNNNTTALATSSLQFTNRTSSQYHWLEFSITMNGSSSTASLYMDGTLQWSGTYALSAFPAAAVSSVAFSWGNPVVSSGQLDDVIIWDNTGSAFNSFPIGPRRIGCQQPSGAGASTQFTPSSGSNWSCVGQSNYQGTLNVSDTGSGNTDLYAQGALAWTPATVNAVVVNTHLVDPAGGGTRSCTTKLRSGSTPAVANGATRTCPANLTAYQDFFYTDSSSAAWTPTTVNSSQAGIGD